MKHLFLSISVRLLDYESLKEDFSQTVQGAWLPYEKLHLTLAFFGNMYEKESLIETFSTLKFHIQASQIKGLSLFSHKKILYAKSENDSIVSLHKEIQEAFCLKNDEFIPHITLMRIKKIKSLSLFEKKLQLYNEKIIGNIQPNIELIQSTLTSKGSVYKCLSKYQS